MNSIAGRLILTLWLVAIFALALANGGAAQQGGGKQTTFLPLAAARVSLREKPNLADYLAVGTSGAGEEMEIYTVRGDGSAPTRLTDNTLRDDEPQLSPDGEWIAFVRYGESANEVAVYVMRRDGSELRRMHPVPLYYGVDFRWSSTGSHLLVRGRSNLTGEPNTYALFLVPLANPDNYRLLTNDAAFGEFSPNGAYLYYRVIVSMNPGVTAWWVAPVAGGDPVFLVETSTGSGMPDPVWTPDSRELLVVRYSEERRDFDYWLVTPDGVHERLLFPYAHHFRGWLNNGDTLLLQRFRPIGDPTMNVNLYLAPRAGGDPTQLTDYSDALLLRGVMPATGFGDVLIYQVAEGEGYRHYVHPVGGTPQPILDFCDQCHTYLAEPAADGSAFIIKVVGGDIYYLPLATLPVAHNISAGLPTGADAEFLPGLARYGVAQSYTTPPRPNVLPQLLDLESLTYTQMPFPTGNFIYSDWRYLPD